MSSRNQLSAVSDNYKGERVIRANSLGRTVTVDTSRARSNADAVRLCLAQLGWKDVSRSYGSFGYILMSFSMENFSTQMADPTVVPVIFTGTPLSLTILGKSFLRAKSTNSLVSYIVIVPNELLVVRHNCRYERNGT